MKFIYSSKKAFSFSILSFFLIANAAAQDCSTTQPLAASCQGGAVVQDFNSSNGNFSAGPVTPSTAGSAFVYSSNAFSAVVNNSSSGTFVLNSPTYVKGSTNPNVLVGGFTLDAGNKVTVSNITLDIVRVSDGVTIASCTRTGLSQTNGLVTYCISITDPDIISGLQFQYRFTFTLTGDASGSSNTRTVIFDNFSQGGLENIPLPVKLSSFTAMRDNNHVKLQWSTASEANNKGFEIERKLNGASAFETIAFIASLSKTGNSDVKLDYDFTDINMSVTATQYRLKQIDLDGKIVYSDIRTADGIRENASVMIYPNPSKNGNTNLVFGANGSRTIRVMDISGRSVMQYNNYRNAQLLIDGLKKGSYIITVLDHANNQQETLRLVIAQ